MLGILFSDVDCPRILRRITGEELLEHTTEVAQIEQNSQSIKVRVLIAFLCPSRTWWTSSSPCTQIRVVFRSQMPHNVRAGSQ